MTDRIELRGLRLLGHHGANPGEQDRAQPFEVDLDIEFDMSTAARTDDLVDALDYGGVVTAVNEIVVGRSYALIEAIAGAIADKILESAGVISVTVTLRKLHPPVPYDLASAGVRVTRRADR